MKSTRRHFLLSSAGLVSALALSRHAVADTPHVDENDPMAKQMSYTHDASSLDPSSQPKFAAGDACANCQLFQGKPGDAWGPCPIFSGKEVSAKGWCTAYTKKS